VNGGADLIANGAHRQIHAGHEGERFQPGDRFRGGVGVGGCERAVVAGVHRLEHVERLAAAALPHDDAVRTHAQRVPDQITDGVLAAPLEVCGACLQGNDVRLLELQLGCVFDGDDAFFGRDRSGQDIEERRLAAAGAAGDDDVLLGDDAAV
jgi:hypothetical protein